MDWLALKDETARMMFDKDALHIYVAVAIQVAAALLSRRSLGYFLPWLAVLGCALVNEALDVVLGQEQILQPWQVVGGVHDLINRWSFRPCCCCCAAWRLACSTGRERAV
ncbi:MAG: hypothetical protein M3Q57_07585 [Pseudomonadota bacterium]|nr:hypothetical protein [Pseudomonadota bacterium]